MSAPIPVPLLWTLDFRLWVLDLGLGLGLDNKTFYDFLYSMSFHDIPLPYFSYLYYTNLALSFKPPNKNPSMSKDPHGYLGFISQDIEFRNIKP